MIAYDVSSTAVPRSFAFFELSHPSAQRRRSEPSPLLQQIFTHTKTTPRRRFSVVVHNVCSVALRRSFANLKIIARFFKKNLHKVDLSSPHFTKTKLYYKKMSSTLST